MLKVIVSMLLITGEWTARKITKSPGTCALHSFCALLWVVGHQAKMLGI